MQNIRATYQHCIQDMLLTQNVNRVFCILMGYILWMISMCQQHNVTRLIKVDD